MMRAATLGRPADWLALGKPGITGMAVLMALGMILVAPEPMGLFRTIGTLAGIALLTGSANTFNMIAERSADALMERTRARPLPAGRMAVAPALVLAVGMGVVSLALLRALANDLTAGLGLLALLLYVGVYTPLKYITPVALLVGAVPGAMPVLLGHAAATGSVNAFGMSLALVLFAWQIPHFLAITLFRSEEYGRAGMRVHPLVHGADRTRVETLAYTLALVPVSLIAVPLGAGMVYGAVALAAGLWLAWLAWRVRAPQSTPAQARSYFLATLVYLPVLVLGLVVGRFTA